MRFELLASCGLGSALPAFTGLLILCAGATAEAEDRSNFSGSGREFIAIIQAEVAELEAQRDALELAAKAAAFAMHNLCTPRTQAMRMILRARGTRFEAGSAGKFSF